MDQVPLVLPELGAVGVVHYIQGGSLRQVVLRLVAKGVAEVKGAMCKFMPNHVDVAAKVEDKAILACQRHIARTVALGGTHEKEV